jgi:Fur family transcriptional regulator, ferric uptake regulator
VTRIRTILEITTRRYTRSVQWAHHVRSVLDDAGYRSGGAREAVVRLLDRQNCCLSAQEIFDRLRSARRPVGIASVYRALDTLAELRLVKRIDAGDGIARYEPLRPDGDHHHHLVCRDCGKVEAFTDPRLERAIDRAAGDLGYAVHEHEVVLTGACASCS